MNKVGTIKVRSLDSSRVGMKLSKPLDAYRFEVIEKNRFGDYLCVVFDGETTVGIADVSGSDVESFEPEILDPEAAELAAELALMTIFCKGVS